jgi:Carboxypeptidase regulatory-like domain/TonB dependent receptor-like, beta-barrel/TonB-dependent Receptor Plug Domain
MPAMRVRPGSGSAQRIFALMVCFIFEEGLYAQFETASVLGTVNDESGAVLPGASVTLTHNAMGISARTFTDENGNYQFLNVKIGNYRVEVQMASFSAAVIDNVQVAVGARQRVDFSLKLGELNTTIEVAALAASVLETDTSDRGQVVNQRQIVELPLNGRNYSDLALLTTGVRRSAYAFANPPREGAFNVNGQRSIFNNFLMDGIDNNSYGTSNQGFSNQVMQLTPDAVAEFKVVTSLMSAEYGRSSGAVINVSMKSGTNEFHGTAWEYLRNTSLNAAGFFRPATGKPVFQRNQFGLTFGGPIVKSRVFFYTDYEGFRERLKFPEFSSLPTLDDRQGIFPVAVRNPLTEETFPANSPIPQDRITPFARRVLSELPPPNTGSGRGNNFVNLRRDTNNNDKIDLKLDGQISSRSTTFVRLSHRKSNIFQAPTIPGPSGGGGNGFIRVLNQQMASGYTYTPSAPSLLEIRVGLSRTRAGKEPPGLGGPSMRELYGIAGLSEDPRLTGGLTPQEVTGFSAFGRQATNPQWQHPFVTNAKANYSYILGRHSLKVGYEYQRIHTEIQDVNPLYGRDIYNGQFSRPAGSAADSQTHNLADFMFGARSEYQLVNFYIAQYRQAMNFAYLQNDWKVNSRLTLNLGVRYEYATPQWERDNRLSNFDPVSNQLIQAKKGSVVDRALVNPDRNNWAPRFGLAYSMDNRTVIRSGYGISYVHFNRAGGGNILGINGPQVVIAAIAQNPAGLDFRPTQQGYPQGLTDPDKFNPILANISYIPPDSPSGYVQNWSFSIQREIFRNTILDLAYVGSKSTHLILFADYNEARPNRPGESLSIQARRPNQAFGAITVTWPGAFANYHALQAKFERRLSSGFYFLNSFVYSKAIDNVGQALEAQGSGGRSSPQSFYNIRAEKAVSDFDQTFNNTTSIVYELPFGKGRRYLSSVATAADYVLGGWQLSAINNMWSGEPLNLAYNPPAAFQVSQTLPDWRGGISYRPNLTGPVMTPSDTRSIDNYLNAATVVVPTDSSQPFGNAGRNVARSYSLYQLDLGMAKAIKLSGESVSLQFRAEAFNLFNNTNFRNANTNRSVAGFGQVRTTFPARQIQFALRLIF